MTVKMRAFLECIQTLMSISLKHTTTYMDIYEHVMTNQKPTKVHRKQRKRNSNITLNKTSKPQGKKPKEERNRKELQNGNK